MFGKRHKLTNLWSWANPNRTNPKKPSHKHIIKLIKTNDKERNVKVVREKPCMTHKGEMIQMTTDFSSDPAGKEELPTQNSLSSENTYPEWRGTRHAQINKI